MWTGDGGAFMRAARSEARGRLAMRKPPSSRFCGRRPAPANANRGRRCVHECLLHREASRERTSVPCSQAGAANGYSMPSTLRVRLIRPPSSMISRMNGGNG